MSDDLIRSETKMSDYLTSDLQFHILSLLPPKTVLQCRCVCKPWKQIIDSQSFVRSHIALQKPRLLAEYEGDDFLVFHPGQLTRFDTLVSPPIETEPPTITISPLDPQFMSDEDEEPTIRTHIIGTLHGVICLYDAYWVRFRLWNPSIRKFLCIDSPVDFEWVVDDHANDDGDELGSCGAFWIDPSTGDFKIVVFRAHSFDEDDELDVCSLYSSKERDWKELPLGEISLYDTVETTPPVVIDGVAYWRASYPFEEKGKLKYGVVVLLFDFRKERFDTIEALFIDPDLNLPVLCDLDGSLSLLYMNRGKDCDILVWKDDSWAHMKHVSLQPGVSRLLWAQLVMEERQRDSRILATYNDQLALFDTKTYEIFELKSDLKNPNVIYIVNGFVESLLFPEV